MKQMLSENQFISQFMDVRPENFSREGLSALFNFLEEMETDTGEEMEFDPIALCCDFTEYEGIAEFNAEYETEYERVEDIDETLVIDIDGERFIAQDSLFW